MAVHEARSDPGENRGGVKMDVNMIMQAISTVGFPICACGAIFWRVNKQDEQHKAEITALRSVLEANTQALTELKDMIKYTREDKAA
jgi:hypothetical protein